MRRLVPLVLLAWLAPVAFAGDAPVVVTFDRIESRALFGGMGGGGPIGMNTEFFMHAFDRQAPILEVGGDFAQDYPANRAVISRQGEGWQLCEVDASGKATARCHTSVAYSQADIAKRQGYLAANPASYSKTVRYVVPFTVTETAPVGEKDAQGYYHGLRVRLSNWVDGKEVVSIAYHASYRYQSGKEASSGMAERAYLLQSKDDPTLYVCASGQFDNRCFPCADCQLEKLKKYAVREGRQ